MGRTQLQDAVPMTLGQEFHAFSVLLNEETKSILRTAELLRYNRIDLGGHDRGTRLQLWQVDFIEASTRARGEQAQVVTDFRELHRQTFQR